MNFPLSDSPDAAAHAGVFQRPLTALIGFSLLLLVFTSVWDTAGFTENRRKQLLEKKSGVEHVLYVAGDALLQHKAEGILVLAFGAGLFVWLRHSREAGSPLTIDLLIRRQIWLILLGVVNAFLFMYSDDLLFFLGCAGILLFPFAALKPRQLLVLAGLFCLFLAGKMYWDYADKITAFKKYQAVMAIEKKWPKEKKDRSAADTLTTEQQDDKSAWEGIAKQEKYNKEGDDEKKTAVQEVSFRKNYETLLPGNQQKQSRYFYAKGVWSYGSLILLGMGLYGAGFFQQSFRRSTYGWIFLSAFIAGIFFAWWRLHQQQAAITDFEKYIGLRPLPYGFFFPVEQLCLVMAYTAGWYWLWGGAVFRKAAAVFVYAGRMPLTIYLLYCLLASVFFNGFAMGYYGRLQLWQVELFAAECGLVLLGFSVAWFRFYQKGPLEWLLEYAVTGSRPATKNAATSYTNQTDFV